MDTQRNLFGPLVFKTSKFILLFFFLLNILIICIKRKISEVGKYNLY